MFVRSSASISNDLPASRPDSNDCGIQISTALYLKAQQTPGQLEHPRTLITINVELPSAQPDDARCS